MKLQGGEGEIHNIKDSPMIKVCKAAIDLMYKIAVLFWILKARVHAGEWNDIYFQYQPLSLETYVAQLQN